jgi:Predicted acyl-CoA transferases/carnitine dehydratase
MDPIPALGQQTDAILSELGFTLSAITSLRATGGI